MIRYLVICWGVMRYDKIWRDTKLEVLLATNSALCMLRNDEIFGSKSCCTHWSCHMFCPVSEGILRYDPVHGHCCHVIELDQRAPHPHQGHLCNVEDDNVDQQDQVQDQHAAWPCNFYIKITQIFFQAAQVTKHLSILHCRAHQNTNW